MKMEFAEGNGYKLPVARYQERRPNGGSYVTKKEYGTNLGHLLVLFERRTRTAENLNSEIVRQYEPDVRVVCGDVVIAEKVWER
jgi:hypothetical protein